MPFGGLPTLFPRVGTHPRCHSILRSSKSYSTSRPSLPSFVNSDRPPVSTGLRGNRKCPIPRRYIRPIYYYSDIFCNSDFLPFGSSLIPTVTLASGNNCMLLSTDIYISFLRYSLVIIPVYRTPRKKYFTFSDFSYNHILHCKLLWVATACIACT